MFNWFKKDINDPLLVLLRRISEQFKQSNVTAQNILEWHQSLGVRLMNIENKLDELLVFHKEIDEYRNANENWAEMVKNITKPKITLAKNFRAKTKKPRKSKSQ